MRWLISLCVAVALAALGFWFFRSAQRAQPLEASQASAPQAALAPTPTSVEAPLDPAAQRAPAAAAAQAPPQGAIPGALELRVRGRCVDTQARPVAGARIQCWLYYFAPDLARLADTREYAGFDEDAEPRTESDAEGRFELAFAPAKGLDSQAFTVRMWISADGRARADASVDFARGEVGDAGAIVLPFGATLRGSVVDSDGSPVEGARVAALAEQAPGWTRRARGGSYSGEPAKSAADGRFALAGVAPGALTLRARSDDFRESKRLALEIAEGETRAGLELVLPALDDANSVSGIVVSPQGEPVPSVHVSASWSFPGGSGSGRALTNKAGVFRVELTERLPVRLRAEDSKQRFGGVTLENVAGGTHGLRVQLEEPRFLNLRAESAGTPLERFGWALRIQRDEHSFEVTQAESEAPRPGGRARVFASSDPFFVELRAQGYRSLELGPFRVAELPAEALFALERAAGIRGRIEAGGKPLAGARVELWNAPGAGRQAWVDGFPAQMLPRNDKVEAQSAADGTFLLFVPAPGLVHLRASAPGFAPTISAALDPAPERGIGGLVLALGAGGGIEGRAFGPDGAVLAAQWIAADDGWPPIACTKSDAQGTFRFEHLAPGPYRLKTLERPLWGDAHAWSEGSSQAGSAAPAPGDCVVREGETTHFDLRPEPTAELVLSFPADLRALGQWNVEAAVVSNGISSEGRATWNSARDELRIAFATAGTCALFLDLPGEQPGSSRCTISSSFELAAGASRRDLEVRLGTVKGRLAQGGGPAGRVMLYARLAPDWELFSNARVDEQRNFVFPCAPAGKCSISREGGSQREIELKAGETLEIEDL